MEQPDLPFISPHKFFVWEPEKVNFIIKDKNINFIRKLKEKIEICWVISFADSSLYSTKKEMKIFRE